MKVLANANDLPCIHKTGFAERMSRASLQTERHIPRVNVPAHAPLHSSKWVTVSKFQNVEPDDTIKLWRWAQTLPLRVRGAITSLRKSDYLAKLRENSHFMFQHSNGSARLAPLADPQERLRYRFSEPRI
jgi:hypothetical protein